VKDVPSFSTWSRIDKEQDRFADARSLIHETYAASTRDVRVNKPILSLAAEVIFVFHEITVSVVVRKRNSVSIRRQDVTVERCLFPTNIESLRY